MNAVALLPDVGLAVMLKLLGEDPEALPEKMRQAVLDESARRLGSDILCWRCFECQKCANERRCLDHP